MPDKRNDQIVSSPKEEKISLLFFSKPTGGVFILEMVDFNQLFYQVKFFC